VPEYRITEKAGPQVAGRKNPGKGMTIFLTPREAAHDLRVGAIELAKSAKASKVVGKHKGGPSA
jgi:hypothetical protein